MVGHCILDILHVLYSLIDIQVRCSPPYWRIARTSI